MRCSLSDLAKLLSPWSVGVVVLLLLPMVIALVLSTMRLEVSPTGHVWSYVGIDHYSAALSIDTNAKLDDDDPWVWHWLGGRPSDPRFYRSLVNSLIFTFIAVPLGLATSLAVACLLVGSCRGMTFVRACVYLPHLLGGVATLLVWSWLDQSSAEADIPRTRSVGTHARR